MTVGATVEARGLVVSCFDPLGIPLGVITWGGKRWSPLPLYRFLAKASEELDDLDLDVP